jgi:hypothetical protein
MATKKFGKNIPLLCFVLDRSKDPVSEIEESGSGMNIPDPQHCF